MMKKAMAAIIVLLSATTARGVYDAGEMGAGQKTGYEFKQLICPTGEWVTKISGNMSPCGNNRLQTIAMQCTNGTNLTQGSSDDCCSAQNGRCTSNYPITDHDKFTFTNTAGFSEIKGRNYPDAKGIEQLQPVPINAPLPTAVGTTGSSTKSLKCKTNKKIVGFEGWSLPGSIRILKIFCED